MTAGIGVVVCALAFVATSPFESRAEGGPGVLDLSVSTASVAETDGPQTTVEVSLLRSVGNDGVASVDYALGAGSATPGADFVVFGGATGTLTWADLESAPQTITIVVNADQLVEGSETLSLSLTNPVGAALGTVTTVAVTILDDDNGGTVAFSSAVYNGGEADGSAPSVTVTVNRSAGIDGSASVQFAASDGSAGSSDYSGGDGTLTWGDQVGGSQTFTVALTDDNEVEATETVALSLSGATGASLGAPAAATLSIADDDSAGTVQFGSATYSVLEGEGVLTVTVTRAGGIDGAIAVNHRATDGTAHTPGDYTSGDGTLSWPEGDSSPRTFLVEIVDDSANEGPETVQLSLSGATGGVTLGSPSEATLTIVDDAGGSGDDRFVIRTSQPGGITIDGRNGSDVYRVDLGGLVGPVSTFDSGSTGFDTIEINAPASNDELQLRVLGGGIVQFIRGGDIISMRGIEVLVLSAGGGNDTLVVDATGTSTTPGFSSFTLASLRVTAISHETARFVGTSRGTRAYSLRSYWSVDSSGGVFAFGGAGFFGSTGGARLNRPIVKLAATPTGNGYWLVASDGGIFSYGDARFLGSTGGLRLNRPIVGMTPTPTGDGYWLVASDGGIFSYGDARFFGSTGGVALNRPIVGMAVTPTGNGYWLVASDGGIFSYGDARFFGSTGGVALNRPIVGMAVTPTGNGYWLVASDGGIFAYGDARFLGSTGAIALQSPVVRMVATPSGTGYWFVAADGGIFAFGDAIFSGSAAGVARAIVVDIDAMTLP